jgi:hypothetical protein
MDGGKREQYDHISGILRKRRIGAFANLPPFLEKLVGTAGLEPATPCSQGKCATRLRYVPTRK